jgi:multicomponent Na+:H+ antiporter subunit E
VARFAISLVLLTLTFCAVLASFSFGDVVLGVLISSTVLVVFRGFLFGGKPKPMPDLPTRLLYLPLFVGATVWDILKGTFEVIGVVLRLKPLRQPGIVAIPIGERTAVGIAVSALATTLSPGTYLVEVDHDRGVWYVHALDASDPEAVRRDHERFYQRYQKRVFP